MEWLPAASTTIEPARSDIARWAGGGIIRSSVATRYQLGLTAPGRVGDRSPQRSDAPGNLRVGHEGRLVGAQVGGERIVELLAVEEQEPVPWGQDRRDRCSGRRVGDEGVHGLALVRGEGGDVDEGCDVVVRTGLRDDCSTVGVTHQDGWAVLSVQDEPRRGDIALEGQGRVLDDADVEPFLHEEAVDPLPAGAVNEAAVDEDHVSRCACWRS